jgi:hypothetical protein
MACATLSVEMGSAHRRRVLSLAVAASVAVTAGCGGSGSATTVPAKPLSSYLALYPRDKPLAVYFLQWQRRGDSVDGTLTVVYATAKDTPYSSHPVEGEIDDESVKLDVGTDPPQQWEGDRNARRIVFRAELEGGSAQTLTFVPARLADYKRAVAQVRAGP